MEITKHIFTGTGTFLDVTDISVHIAVQGKVVRNESIGTVTSCHSYAHYGALLTR